jgi:hypothetical protein
MRAHPTPGIRAKPAATLWNEFVTEFYKKQKAAKQAAEREAEWQESKKAAQESKRSGYVPTREAIEVQLGQLLANDKISQADYDWGIKGLPSVHEKVEAAKDSGQPARK